LPIILHNVIFKGHDVVTNSPAMAGLLVPCFFLNRDERASARTKDFPWLYKSKGKAKQGNKKKHREEKGLKTT
jgi:hypothetical protein